MTNNSIIKTESFLCGTIGQEVKVTYEIDRFQETHAFDAHVDILKIENLPEDDEEYSMEHIIDNLQEQIRIQLWKKTFFDADDRADNWYDEMRDNM